MKQLLSLPHYGQIPTLMKAIKLEMWDKDLQIINSLIRCLLCPLDSAAYKNNLIIASSLLERISCLVYRGKDGKYRKPSPKMYVKEVFERFAETVEEVSVRAVENGNRENDSVHLHKVLWKIAELICPMMACITEQAFTSEYAYAIDYVIRHDGDLPKPEMREIFPINYSDYHYWEGIGEEVSKYKWHSGETFF